MTLEKSSYTSYMLRFWQETEEAWRLRLEPVGAVTEASSLIKHFADAESLMQYLKDANRIAREV